MKLPLPQSLLPRRSWLIGTGASLLVGCNRAARSTTDPEAGSRGRAPRAARDAGLGAVTGEGGIAPGDAGGLCELEPGSSPAELGLVDSADSGVVDAGANGITTGCRETSPDILGPYYREQAPFRSALAAPESIPCGQRLIITGHVHGLRARDGVCVPLGGALLDVWQADPAGAYDLTEPEFFFRARLESDEDGAYAFETALPGRYLNGSVYRPRHIHIIVSAPGFLPLTTQIYFRGDPFIATDPFAHPSLVVALGRARNVWQGRFPVVLAEG